MKDKKSQSSFELAKPMNMVLMSWSKGMTPMQIKTIHIMTIQLKKWIMDTNFKPNPEQSGIDAYQGIKTSFEMSIDDFAKMMQTSKRALKTAIKDENGDTIMYKRFPKLRIMEYFEEVQKVKCTVNSQHVIGSFNPVSAAIYDKDAETVRLETTFSMAIVLQDEAFAKNLSFVDMQLQLSLNSVMASHILDRISRFKHLGRDYSCTVGDLVEQCGIEERTMKDRGNFIKVNITRPLKQIEDKSNGVWERIGTGASVTAKKRGTLLKEDTVKFKMKYNDPTQEVAGKDITPKEPSLMLFDELENVLHDFVSNDDAEVISKEVLIQFGQKSMAAMAQVMNNSSSPEELGDWIKRMEGLKNEAAQKYIEMTGNTPY